MEIRSPEELKGFVELERAKVVDERAKGGEVNFNSTGQSICAVTGACRGG